MCPCTVIFIVSCWRLQVEVAGGGTNDPTWKGKYAFDLLLILEIKAFKLVLRKPGFINLKVFGFFLNRDFIKLRGVLFNTPHTCDQIRLQQSTIGVCVMCFNTLYTTHPKNDLSSCSENKHVIQQQWRRHTTTIPNKWWTWNKVVFGVLLTHSEIQNRQTAGQRTDSGTKDGQWDRGWTAGQRTDSGKEERQMTDKRTTGYILFHNSRGHCFTSAMNSNVELNWLPERKGALYCQFFFHPNV